MEPIVLVHGGAGDIPDSRVPLKLTGVKKAASLGYQILKNGGSVVDAVEEAVKSMEDDEAFNAGKPLVRAATSPVNPSYVQVTVPS
jgi:beta-aspartyl-peptidase (threonine type)